jgi:hypothetical protein
MPSKNRNLILFLSVDVLIMRCWVSKLSCSKYEVKSSLAPNCACLALQIGGLHGRHQSTADFYAAWICVHQGLRNRIDCDLSLRAVRYLPPATHGLSRFSSGCICVQTTSVASAKTVSIEIDGSSAWCLPVIRSTTAPVLRPLDLYQKNKMPAA